MIGAGGHNLEVVIVPSVFRPRDRTARYVRAFRGDTAGKIAQRVCGGPIGTERQLLLQIDGKRVDDDREITADDVTMTVIAMPAIEAGALVTLLVYAVISAVISAGLSFVISKLFPAPKPSEGPADASATYSWSGIHNTATQGGPVPLIYGEHPIGGQFILGPFRRNPSEDSLNSNLYYILGIGQGPLKSCGQYEQDMDYLVTKGRVTDTFSSALADLQDTAILHPPWRRQFGTSGGIAPNATVAVAAGGTMGLAMNMADASNMHRVYRDGGGLRLAKRVAGVDTVLGTYAGIANNDTVAMWRYRDRIHVEVNGTEQILADADSTLSSNVHGLINGVIDGYSARDDVGVHGKNVYLEAKFVTTAQADDFVLKGVKHLPDGMTFNGIDANTYRHVHAWVRLGHERQEQVGGLFNKIIQGYDVDLPILKNWTEYKFRREVEGFHINIDFPRGLYQVTAGSPATRTVTIDVEYRENDAGTWAAISGSPFTITEFSTTEFTRSVIHEPGTALSGTAQQFRIRRRETPSEHLQLVSTEDECRIGSVNEIEGDIGNSAYDNIAHIAIQIRATDQLNGSQAPTTISLWRGLQVPKWTGTGTAAEPELVMQYDDNPAWIAMDLLLNKRYGLGNWIKVSDIDWAAWQDFGDWCDELLEYREDRREPLYTTTATEDLAEGSGIFVIDDATAAAQFAVGDFIRIELEPVTQILTKTSLGGGRTQYTIVDPATEDYSEGWALHKVELGELIEDQRHRVNIVFDREESAWSAIQRVLFLARAVPMKVGDLFSLRWETTGSKVATVNEANMIAGTFEIRYQGESRKCDILSAEFLNANDNWDRATATAGGIASQRPEDAIVRETINLDGITNPRQARREAQYHLNARRMLKREISFEVALDGLAVLPGDIVEVGRRMPSWTTWTGRATGTKQAMYLSQPLTLESGITYVAIIRTPSHPEGEEFEITRPAATYLVGETVATDAPAPDELVDAIVTIKPEGTAASLWRVTDASITPELAKRIEAIEYNEDVYALSGWTGGGSKPGPSCLTPGTYFLEFLDHHTAAPICGDNCELVITIFKSGLGSSCVTIGRSTPTGFSFVVAAGCAGAEVCFQIGLQNFCGCAGVPGPCNALECPPIEFSVCYNICP